MSAKARQRKSDHHPKPDIQSIQPRTPIRPAADFRGARWLWQAGRGSKLDLAKAVQVFLGQYNPPRSPDLAAVGMAISRAIGRERAKLLGSVNG